MVTAPVYKDIAYVYTGGSLVYSITLNGETIFNGKAYAAPGEDAIRININRICENYLNNYDIEAILTNRTGGYTAYDAFREFLLLDESGNTLETYDFLYCYDYAWDITPGNPSLNNPVTDATATNFIPLKTYFDGTSVSNSCDGDYMYTRNVCDAEYALYYLNARGGWDGLVIEGNSQKTDKISRHQYNKTYNNQTIEYERNTYISEIETSWKLNTGLLDDAQAHNLCWNLLASNRVYLHDLVNDKIYSAVITNTNNVYNTYKNNGHQPISYEIDLVESQTKLRL